MTIEAPQIAKRGIGGGFILENLARQIEGSALRGKRNDLLSFLDSKGFTAENIRSGKWKNFVPILPQQQAKSRQPVQNINNDTVKILAEIQILAMVLKKLLEKIA